MEISVENTGTLGRKLTVQVPAEQVDERVDGRIKEMAQHVRLKGFRPGKVPMTVLRQRFGRDVRREIVGQVIQESFQQALVEKKLRPASPPSIDTDEGKAGVDLSYTASFDIMPELESLDVTSLKLERPVASVGDEDVDAMIETLRQQRRSWSDKEGAAVDGDLAFFSFNVDLGDGERFPAEGEEDARAGAILGQGAFDAAFEAELIGKAGDDEVTFDCTFSETARETALAGKTGKVACKLERVQEAMLPEVDEEFIQSFGIESGDQDSFREEVRQNLDRELRQAVSRRVRQSVVDSLIEAYPDLTVPEAMVEQEAGSMREQARQQLQQAGGDPDQAPGADAFREQAEKRVRAALLITEVARHAELEVDMGRVRDMVNEVASTYDDPQAVVQLYYEREDLLSGIQNVVIEEQAVEWVMEEANVEERTLSFDEIMNPEASAA